MDNSKTTNWHGQFHDVDSNETLKRNGNMPFVLIYSKISFLGLMGLFFIKSSERKHRFFSKNDEKSTDGVHIILFAAISDGWGDS